MKAAGRGEDAGQAAVARFGAGGPVARRGRHDEGREPGQQGPGVEAEAYFYKRATTRLKECGDCWK